MSTLDATISRRACGCICLAIANPLDRKDQRIVGEAVADGYRVEQATNLQVRQGPWGCAVCKPPAPEQGVLL